jgi:hypothetical protein
MLGNGCTTPETAATAAGRHLCCGPERDITPFRNYSLPEIRAGYRSLIGGTMRSIRHAIVAASLLLAAVPAAAQSNIQREIFGCSSVSHLAGILLSGFLPTNWPRLLARRSSSKTPLVRAATSLPIASQRPGQMAIQLVCWSTLISWSTSAFTANYRMTCWELGRNFRHVGFGDLDQPLPAGTPPTR